MANPKNSASRVPAGIQESFSSEEQTQFDDMKTGDAAPVIVEAPAPVAPKPDAPKPAVTKPAAEAAPVGDKAPAPGDDKGGADDGKGGMVPHGAMHAEREGRKKAEADLATERAARAAETADRQKLETRLTAILEKLTPKEEEPKPDVIPDKDLDPVGYVTATMNATGKSLETVQAELAALKERDQQTQHQRQQTEFVHGIISKAAAKETEFLATTPDYWDASNYLLQSRQDELSDLGYTPQEIQGLIAVEKVAIADQALKAGKNPAEVVYGIAKRRGYTKAAPAGDDKGAPADGGAPAAGEDAGKRLAAAKLGQEQSASLSDVGGAAPRTLTVQALLEMPEAEFDKWMGTKEGRALMGS